MIGEKFRQTPIGFFFTYYTLPGVFRMLSQDLDLAKKHPDFRHRLDLIERVQADLKTLEEKYEQSI